MIIWSYDRKVKVLSIPPAKYTDRWLSSRRLRIEALFFGGGALKTRVWPTQAFVLRGSGSVYGLQGLGLRIKMPLPGLVLAAD